jgi:hypothetical protein
VWPSATPTKLLPSPMPCSSASLTVCRMPPGSVGSTVRANRVFRVLAGGSLRWASCAASTAPVRESATSHDSADTSVGTSGAPALGRTCVPGRYRGGGWDAVGLGAPGSVPVRATAALGARASAPTTQTAEQERAARETAARETAARDENPMVIPQT